MILIITMRDNFDAALAMMLRHEGGYVNHPHDPGGETNRGVTKAVYDRFRADAHLPARSVRHISAQEINIIYRRQYWDRIRGDDLPSGVDYAVFDFAVNSGTMPSAKMLQRRAGVREDGRIGPATLAALRAMPAAAIITGFCADRLAFLRGLTNFRHFGKGWTARVDGVRINALSMAKKGGAA
jgi:lysozyme family protein